MTYPSETMMSAVSIIKFSLMHSLGYLSQSMMQRNLSQVIHPIGYEEDKENRRVDSR